MFKTALSINFFLVFSFLCIHASFATDSKGLFAETDEFFVWLQRNEKNWASCRPIKKKGFILLCDGTRVDFAELVRMFKMSTGDLVRFIQNKEIVVNVLCEKGSPKGVFSAYCKKNFDNQLFKKTKTLHGRYLPEKKMILIRNTATRGSLIHEYIHYLQSKNKNKVYGRVYKSSRSELQKKLTKVMDEKIGAIEKIKKTGKGKTNVKKHLDVFLRVVSQMKRFGKWQDLIDERGIFLLYLKFAKDLGVAKEDIEIAQKNMKFICQRKDLQGLPLTGCL